jgi:hypothetical protein
MSEVIPTRTRELIAELNLRLHEAEQLRTGVAQRLQQRASWPEDATAANPRGDDYPREC